MLFNYPISTAEFTYYQLIYVKIILTDES